MLASKPVNQSERLAAIRQYGLGERVHAGQMTNLVELASQITDCPIALVSIVHEDCQRFEAACGLAVTHTGLEASICSHAILQQDILEIEDLRADPRTADNPLVLDKKDPLQFYAGAQIVTSDGVMLGSLCVMDRTPRRLSDSQRRGLRTLADQAMRMLELHDAMRAADTLRKEADHRVKNSLTGIAALARMSAATASSEETRSALEQVQNRIQATAKLHGQLYRQSHGGEGLMSVPEYLEDILSSLRDLSPDDVSLTWDIAPLALRSQAVGAIGLIVNEMVTNAFKHGFADAQPGTVTLVGRRDGRHTYELICRDDGLGSGASEEEGTGLGSQLMRATAVQLGGQISCGPRSDGPGYEARVTFAVTSEGV
ncbi:sensor histidine kinase [Jannaschia pagri]|uniref:histidine kinase n=1 Tax=Jannaschia pagri TaxID=2829797 RepID=A0ABQ4NNV6_9RHOB|nr:MULTISPECIES: histidine kinase dimerization/phosphoacceptor domain -containing protein [unclassified Jannaschia]GIT92261.1 sensor histidine kinase [Jannaschia sp. AI_61]GIT96095.1 sensor histidine kinase [Jannaschia sp. AI_62]